MSYFLHVLTLKGLDYIITNNPEPDIRDAVRKELRRRRAAIATKPENKDAKAPRQPA